jgi:hypothetical protein
LNADKAAELTKPISENEIMPRKARTPRGGLAADARELNKANRARTGRSAETRRLARETDKTAEEIHAVVKPKFKNADPNTTKKLVLNERSKPQSNAS